MEDNKRLIPFSVKNIDKNKWSVTIDENEPFEVECDESQMRKIALRMKAKNGDGQTHKRSSKNGTYLSMLDGETHYCWKSKCPKSAEEFKSLLETKLSEEEIFDNLKCLDEEDKVNYIFDEFNYLNDNEIINKVDKYIKTMQTGGEMASQVPTNIKYRGGIMNLYESVPDVIEFEEFEKYITDTITHDKKDSKTGKIMNKNGLEVKLDDIVDYLCSDTKTIELWNKSMTCSDNEFNKVIDKLSRNIEIKCEDKFNIVINVF